MNKEIKIKKALILVAERDRKTKRMVGLNGCVIEFFVNDNVEKGTKLLVIHDEKKHYFNVREIEVTDDNKLLIRSVEVGYYVNRFDQIKGLDLRSLSGASVSIVKDEETLKYIEESSCWC
jgi:hypothetical protein